MTSLYRPPSATSKNRTPAQAKLKPITPKMMQCGLKGIWTYQTSGGSRTTFKETAVHRQSTRYSWTRSTWVFTWQTKGGYTPRPNQGGCYVRALPHQLAKPHQLDHCYTRLCGPWNHLHWQLPESTQGETSPKDCQCLEQANVAASKEDTKTFTANLLNTDDKDLSVQLMWKLTHEWMNENL